MKTRAPILVGLVTISLALSHCSSDSKTANSTGGTGGTAGATTGGTSSGGTSSGGTSNVGGTSNGGASAGAAGMAGGSATAGAAGAGGAGGAGPSCPTTSAQLADALAQIVCQKNVDCCAGTDQNACLNTVGDHIQNQVYPGLAGSLAAGSAAIDCVALKTCSDAIAAAACADWPLGGPARLPVDEPACLTIISPKIAEGDACTQNYQCTGGFCFTGTGGDNVCHTYAGLDNTCDPNQNPDPDQRCLATAQFCDTATNKCAAMLDDGEACTGNGQCKSGNCDTGTNTCANPTVCQYDPGCTVVPGRTSGAPRGLAALLLGLGLAVGLRRRR